MKPRRWYSSPELNPNPSAPTRPFPESVYWSFTARTLPEQGPIIKSAPTSPPTPGREVGVRLTAPRVRLIDAA